MTTYITPATQKRINKLLKNYLHVSFEDGEEYFAFVGHVCTALKNMLEEQMNRADCVDLKDHTIDNTRLQVSVWKKDQILFRALQNWYPDHISCTFCMDLSCVTIYDFNKLIRLIERDADEIDHNRWF